MKEAMLDQETCLVQALNIVGKTAHKKEELVLTNAENNKKLQFSLRSRVKTTPLAEEMSMFTSQGTVVTTLTI